MYRGGVMETVVRMVMLIVIGVIGSAVIYRKLGIYRKSLRISMLFTVPALLLMIHPMPVYKVAAVVMTVTLVSYMLTDSVVAYIEDKKLDEADE